MASCDLGAEFLAENCVEKFYSCIRAIGKTQLQLIE